MSHSLIFQAVSSPSHHRHVSEEAGARTLVRLGFLPWCSSHTVLLRPSPWGEEGGRALTCALSCLQSGFLLPGAASPNTRGVTSFPVAPSAQILSRAEPPPPPPRLQGPSGFVKQTSSHVPRCRFAMQMTRSGERHVENADNQEEKIPVC